MRAWNKKKFLLIIFLLLGAIATETLFLCKNFRRNVTLKDVTIRAEDLSATGINVHHQGITARDFYDMPLNQEILNFMEVRITGDYVKTENYVYLNSSITKYISVQNAETNFDISRNIIRTELATDIAHNWQIAEEFSPKWKNSTNFQYKQCIFASDLISQKNSRYWYFYKCKVSSIINDNYLFIFNLSGYGKIGKDDINYLLEIVLNNRDTILERLP